MDSWLILIDRINRRETNATSFVIKFYHNIYFILKFYIFNDIIPPDVT